MINKMLKLFKDFLKAFINNIIIFLKSDDKYLDHLNQVIELLNRKGVTLKEFKSFLNYLLVPLLS